MTTMSTTTPPVDPARLLQASLHRQLPALAAEVGVSVPRLAMQCLQLIEDPEVMAAHPVTARLLRDRRDAGRAARSGRW